MDSINMSDGVDATGRDIPADNGGRTAVVTTGDADEGYETAGKKDLLGSRGLAKETKKVVMVC